MKKQILLKCVLAIGTSLLIVLTLGPYVAQEACAQGIQCPPGFNWQRLSGVGCVQADCLNIVNARYGYTGNCICNEGYKGCYKPVDYAGFDRSQCGPFCPISRLIVCVKSEEPCPDEKPAQPPQPKQPQGPIASQPGDKNIGATLPSLEELIAGGKFKGSTPAQAATGGLIASGLLGAWALTNILGSPVVDVARKDKEQEQQRKTTMFRIRNVRGGELTLGGSFKILTVEIQEMIWDPESREYITGRKSQFTFTGAGVTLGAKIGLTSHSSWQEFSTDRPARLEDFEGFGGLACPPSAQIGTHSIGWPPQYRFINPKAKVSIEGWSSEAGIGVGGVIGGWWEMHGPY